MRLASRFLLATLLLSALAVPLGAQDGRPFNGHWWCFVTPPEPSPIYVTGVWDGNFDRAEVLNAFSQEMRAKYGATVNPSCPVATLEQSTVAQIQAGLNAQVTAWKGAGRKVVPVSWTYSNATARLPYFCNAVVQTMKDGKRLTTLYYTKILRIPGANQAKVSMAWDAHVKTLRPGAYFPGGMAGCLLASPDTAAQRKLPDGYIEMYKSQNPEVIKLDWDFEVPSDEALAAAKVADDAPAFYCEMVGEGSKSWYGTPVQADKGWKWEDYTGAWRLHAKNILKLDPNLFRGACEPGTMKTQTRARAVRKEGFSGQGWKLNEVDWRYQP